MSQAVQSSPTPNPGAPSLTDAERARLAAVADQLITGGAGLPSASAADVHSRWIDVAMAARPDLGALLRQVLEHEGEPATLVDQLQREDPDRFRSLGLLIAGAYLMNPAVRRTLGYPGPVPVRNPALPDETEAYLEEANLDAVIARGPIYRPTPRP